MKMTHLHKTARAKIPDDLLLIYKVIERRHSQVSKTVFIL